MFIKLYKRFGRLVATAAVGLGFAGALMAEEPTDALGAIQALAEDTSTKTVLATIAGLAVFAAIFIVRKLRSGVNAGAGR